MHRSHARYLAPGADEDSALIGRHAALVDRAARRFALRVGIPSLFDDLWSAGALGLLEAARRYDPGQNVRFETFAEHRIRGAMLDELRRLDHLPRRLRAETEKVAKGKRSLAQELGREPTAEEVSVRLGMDLEAVAGLEQLGQPHVPLLDELPPAGDGPLPDESASRRELQRALAAAVDALPERQRLLLSLHYVEGLTYREIARVLSVSEPRVCQIHADAVAALRRTLGEER